MYVIGYIGVCVYSVCIRMCSVWVINDKEVSTSSGDAGARRRGPWSGARETCVWGIETRGVVKVNRMSTEFRGVSLCHSWTYAPHWNGEDVDVKNTNRAGGSAVQTNRRRRESSRAPDPIDRLHTMRLASFVRARRRRVRAIVGIARDPFASRRFVVSRSSERTINRNHS